MLIKLELNAMSENASNPRNIDNNLAARYIKKWDDIVFSTKRVEYKNAISAVTNAYRLLGLSNVNLVFLSSPYIDSSLLNTLDLSRYVTPKRWLKDKLLESIWNQTDELYFSKPYGGNKYHHLKRVNDSFEYLCEIIYTDCAVLLDEWVFSKIFTSEFLDTNPWLYDFHINHINNQCNLEIWNAWKYLCEECPYLLAFNNTCIIIDRPSELCLDRELRPHSNGKAAIKFVDGYEIYCSHGIVIPANYGKFYSSNWRSEWILNEQLTEDNEDLVCTLHNNIGYDKFCNELPNLKNRYWKNYQILISCGINIIIYWQFFHCRTLYRRMEDLDNKTIEDINIEKLIKNLPFKLSQELHSLYQNYYYGKHQLVPGLYFYLRRQAIGNLITGLDSYLVRLFHGDRQEIYYVLCDNEERLISHVYCQFPGEEPVIYAECVTSLIVTLAQCYQEGAYYIAIDEETGERSIEQDLDKIEPIFEKFNPDQIDNWRKMWKS
jgi:hypothetical protein